MKLFGTKIEKSEYKAYNYIVKEIRTSKYFLGIRISKTYETDKTLIPPITSIERNLATVGKVTLETGMRVIVRGNEPNALMIGKIDAFIRIGKNVGCDNDASPIVTDESDGKKYSTMGIIVPYSDVLMNELKDLKPIEQWNYLAHTHSQIKEKYGIKYKTFR